MDAESHDGYFSFGPQYTDCSDSEITGSAREDPLWLLLSMHPHPGQRRNKGWGRAAWVCTVALTLTTCATLSQLCQPFPQMTCEDALTNSRNWVWFTFQDSIRQHWAHNRMEHRECCAGGQAVWPGVVGDPSEERNLGCQGYGGEGGTILALG